MSGKASSRFSLGIDYGSNSVRALIVRLDDGAEIASAVYAYPSGEAGILLDRRDPNLARQNPADYLQGFLTSVKKAVQAARKIEGFAAERVVGLGVDTTGSTPIPVDRQGRALALDPKWEKELAAHAWLWKDHTSHAEAAEITAKARNHPHRYLDKCGGVYSSEWYWSKILRCARVAPKVFAAAYGWVELADYIPGWLTDQTDPDTMPRGICAAGHKAMFHQQWGGLPAEDFLASLDPRLVPLRSRFTPHPQPSDEKAGDLRADLARQVGLPAGIPVAIGAFDAHHGAVGSGVKPGTLVKIMGTSTCDIMVAPAPPERATAKDKTGKVSTGDTASASPEVADIPGVCGIVPGSVMGGMIGLEAGQSAVGDIFNWFVKHLTPAAYGTGSAAHAKLTVEASQLAPGESGLLALDWNNGNRTVLVDPRLTGLLLGQTLHTTAPEIYRALIEATAFGALTIINRFEDHGVPVKEVINCGGIAEKNPLVMQIYADVCNRPMKVSSSGQTCALGAAIFGAVAAGAYKSPRDAQKKMVHTRPEVYRPIRDNVKVYAGLYKNYQTLHDAFGGVVASADLGRVMKDLLDLRDRVRSQR